MQLICHCFDSCQRGLTSARSSSGVSFSVILGRSRGLPAAFLMASASATTSACANAFSNGVGSAFFSDGGRYFSVSPALTCASHSRRKALSAQYPASSAAPAEAPTGPREEHPRSPGDPFVEASPRDGLRRRESLLEHTGKPGDSGLDGIVRQDALGLDLVGVQAKRFDKENSVQRPDLQAFVGALQGAQTTRGVFVTTGKFSPGAKQFAENVAMRLRLIDGKELTKLMVRYNVGVQVRETFELKQVDEETFDE